MKREGIYKSGQYYIEIRKVNPVSGRRTYSTTFLDNGVVDNKAGRIIEKILEIYNIIWQNNKKVKSWIRKKSQSLSI